MTATETAVRALIAALNASAALPDVRRDPVFDEILEEIAVSSEKFGRALVVRIGEQIAVERRLGLGPAEFEHVRAAEIEWFVAGLNGDDLSATFDAGIEEIFSAVEADATLGGAVTLAEIADPPEIGQEAAGSKTALTAVIRVQLTFTAARAY